MAVGIALAPGPLPAAEIRAGPDDSLALAAAGLAPGNTLLLAPGVYHQRLVLDGVAGTADAPVTIRGEARDRVVFDGGCPRYPCPLDAVDWDAGIGVRGLVAVTESAHIVLRDFTVRDAIAFAVEIDGSREITVANVLIDGAGHGGLIASGEGLTIAGSLQSCAHHPVFGRADHAVGEAAVIGDPRFVNPEGGDFRLRPGSPALGAALPLSAGHGAPSEIGASPGR